MLGCQTMTSIDSHCTRLLGLMNLWSARSPGFVPGDLAKASIVHIAPELWALSTYDQHWRILARMKLLPFPKSLLLKRPCVKSCLVGGMHKYLALISNLSRRRKTLNSTPKASFNRNCFASSLSLYLFLSLCLCIYIYISSSSCCAISMDILDPLLPCLPIVHCLQQVLRATSSISIELLYVGSSWWSCLCTFMGRGSQE